MAKARGRVAYYQMHKAWHAWRYWMARNRADEVAARRLAAGAQTPPSMARPQTAWSHSPEPARARVQASPPRSPLLRGFHAAAEGQPSFVEQYARSSDVLAASPELRARIIARSVRAPYEPHAGIGGEQRNVLRQALLEWARLARGGRGTRVKLTAADRRNRGAILRRALSAWLELHGKAQQEKDMLSRAVRRWRSRQMVRGLLRWRAFLKERKALRVAALAWHRKAEAAALRALKRNRRKRQAARALIAVGRDHWVDRQLHKSLALWRRRTRGSQSHRAARRTAQSHYATRLASRTLSQWQLAAREEQRRRQVINRAVSHWRMRTKGAVFRQIAEHAREAVAGRERALQADEHYMRTIASKALSAFAAQLHVRRAKQARINEAVLLWSESASARAIRRWRERVADLQERRARNHSATQFFLSTMLHRWVANAVFSQRSRELNDLAVSFHVRTVVTRSFDRWMAVAVSKQSLRSSVANAEQFYMRRLAGKVLVAWSAHIAERFRKRRTVAQAAQYHQQRAASVAILKWADFAGDRAARRQRGIDGYRRVQFVKARQAVNRWRAVASRRQSVDIKMRAAVRAVARLKADRAVKLWRSWTAARVVHKARLHRVLFHWNNAFVSRAFNSLKKYLEMRRVKNAASAKARKHRGAVIARYILIAWRQTARIQRHSSMLLSIASQHSEVATLRRMLRALKDGAALLAQERFGSARQHYQSSLQRKVLLAFRGYRAVRHWKVRQQQRGERFHVHFVTRKAVSVWLERTRAHVQLRSRLRKVMAQWTRVAVVSCMEHWKTYLQHRRERKREYMLADRYREDVLEKACFNKLRDYAHVYRKAKHQVTAVARTHARLVCSRSALNRWCDFVDEQQYGRSLNDLASQFRYRRVATQVFTAWVARAEEWQFKHERLVAAAREHQMAACSRRLRTWLIWTNARQTRAAHRGMADTFYRSTLLGRSVGKLAMYAAMRRRKLAVLQRGDKHWSTRSAARGIAAWRSYTVRSIHQSKSRAIADTHFHRHLKVVAFGAIHATSEEHKLIKEQFRTSVLRWKQVVAFRAFARWAEYRRQRQTMRVAAAAFRRTSVRTYFDAWTSGCVVLKRERRQWTKAETFDRQKKLHNAFAEWVHTLHLMNVVKRVAVRMRFRTAGTVFHTWAEWTKHSVRVKTVARKVARRWMSRKAISMLRQWQAWTELRRVSRRVVNMLRSNTLSRCLGAWVTYVEHRAERKQIKEVADAHRLKAASRAFVRHWASWATNSRKLRRVRARWVHMSQIRTLEHWWMYVEYRRRKAAATKDARRHYCRKLCQSTFARWKARWEAAQDARDNLHAADSHYRLSLSRRVVQRWRANATILVASRGARSHYARVLTKKSFRLLAAYARWRRHHADQMHVAKAAGDSLLVGRAIAKWLRHRHNMRIIRRVTVRWQRGLLVYVFARWDEFRQERLKARAGHQKAAFLWRNILAAKALHSWKEFLFCVHEERFADNHAKMVLCRRHFKQWGSNAFHAIADRRNMAAAEQHCAKTRQMRGLRVWFRHYETRAHVQRRLQAATALWADHTEATFFRRWKVYLYHRRAKNATLAVADEHHNKRRLKRGLRVWRRHKEAKAVVVRTVQAAAAHFFFSTEARCFRMIKLYAAHVKERCLLLERGHNHWSVTKQAEAIRVWRQVAKAFAWERRRFRSARRLWRQNTVRKAWATWVCMHVEARRLKRLTVQALQMWRGHREHDCFHGWVRFVESRRHHKRRTAAKKLQRAWHRAAHEGGEQGLHSKLLARRILRRWELHGIHQWLDRRKSDLAVHHCRSATMARAFAAWQVVYRQDRGLETADAHYRYVSTAKAFLGWMGVVAKMEEMRQQAQTAQHMSLIGAELGAGALAAAAARPPHGDAGSELFEVPSIPRRPSGTSEHHADWVAAVDSILSDSFAWAAVEDHSASRALFQSANISDVGTGF